MQYAAINTTTVTSWQNKKFHLQNYMTINKTEQESYDFNSEITGGHIDMYLN